MSYSTKNYTEQGGEKTVIGGEIDITGAIKLDGDEVIATAAQLNKLAAAFTVTEQGAERTVIGGEIDITGAIKLDGVEVTATATQLNKLAAAFTVTVLDGSAGKKACVTNGVSAITGGNGIADMSLAAPSPGDLAIIRIDSLSPSKTVIVTTATGVTFDGTNNTATFDAANESLVLAYKSATEWQVVLNIGGVALSAVGGD